MPLRAHYERASSLALLTVIILLTRVRGLLGCCCCFAVCRMFIDHCLFNVLVSVFGRAAVVVFAEEAGEVVGVGVAAE